MILTLLSGIHADVPVWTQTAVHLNDGSDRTALINEPGLGSSISLSEAKPQKKTFTRAVFCAILKTLALRNSSNARTSACQVFKFSGGPVGRFKQDARNIQPFERSPAALRSHQSGCCSLQVLIRQFVLCFVSHVVTQPDPPNDSCQSDM